MKLKPLGARALVKMVESEEQTASGIVLPDTAREKPQTAEVVTVGDSEEVKVSVGDVVVLAKYSGTEVMIEGRTPDRGCRRHPRHDGELTEKISVRWQRSQTGQSPSPLQEGIRRACRDRGGVGCSEDEREGPWDVEAHAKTNLRAPSPIRGGAWSGYQHRRGP